LHTHDKQIQLLSALDVFIEASKLLSTDKNTLFGKLLLNTNPEIGRDRFQIILDTYSGSPIPADYVDDFILASKNFAFKLECHGKTWFGDYMHLIEMQKSSPNIVARRLNLQHIDQNVLALLEQIGTKDNKLPGSDFDQAAAGSFTMALSIIPVARQKAVLSLSMETLLLLGKRHNLLCSDETDVVHDILRFRLNPDGEDGTVLVTEGSTIMVM